jgi:hypothetical protein
VTKSLALRAAAPTQDTAKARADKLKAQVALDRRRFIVIIAT